jgi:ATP-binding protein involved in chromosome partitioning
MRIVIPVVENKISEHFGHCDEFLYFDVDETTKKILGRESETPPPHKPGLLPRWLGERGATVIIAGGMGMKAAELFSERGIKVVAGVTLMDPTEAVMLFLNGELQGSDSFCEH